MTVFSPLFPPWRPAWVLHEDPDVLVVDKPAGVSTHAPDADRRDDCVSRLRQWLSARDGVAPEAVYLGIHQRLDRDTSGVLLFARRREANPGLARVFEGRAVEKTYLAAMERRVGAPREGVWRHHLAPGEGGAMRVVREHGRVKGALALTRYREVLRRGNRALLELTPETGRTHQLRVQCAEEGSPLAGDALYRGPAAPRLFLHATSLALPHPASGERVTFRSPLPEAFRAWVEGRATPLSPGSALSAALEARYALGTDPDTTAFRLLHDGDGLPGVTVDLYEDWALVQRYDGAEPPDAVLDAVASLGARGVYVKYRPKQANTLVDTRRDALAPASAVRGESAPEELTVRELGLRYRVRLGDGLSTGIFLDQRENRRRVRELSKGLSVLNLFAYTCPFTVAAAAGGASRTVSVDASRGALAWGARNLEENGLQGDRHALVVGDVFAWLEGARARRDRFDLVIVDPPSYSTTKERRFSSESDWRDLATRVFHVVAPGGRVLACTNHRGIPRARFRRYLHEAARAAGRTLSQLKDLPDPVDFPPAPGAEPHLKSALATVA